MSWIAVIAGAVLAATAAPDGAPNTGYVRTLAGAEFDKLEAAARWQCPGTPVGRLTGTGLLTIENTYRATLTPPQQSLLAQAMQHGGKPCRQSDATACQAIDLVSAMRRTALLPDFVLALCRPDVVR